MSTAHDFDFFHGRWTVRHRRLAQRLANSSEWASFNGRCETWPLLGGAGNVDDNVLEAPAGTYRAATFRSWNPVRRTWQIWWLDGRYPDAVGDPMVGSFEGGVGTFFCDEQFEGRPIKVRFIWSRTDTPSPRWEQAFSADGGKTWETNWEMDFTRCA